MKEDSTYFQSIFAPYQQSVEIQQLGFDEPCVGCYYSDKDNVNLLLFKGVRNSDRDERARGGFATAPTYSQAFRWFREKHKLIFYIQCDYNSLLGYIYGYIPIYNLYPSSRDYYKTYEEAELACLKMLIEIVKNK
jgi:hypothetical protein